MNYEQLREDWSRIRNDVDLSDDAVNVVSTALYRLRNLADPVKDGSLEEAREEWPNHPLALVDWYAESEGLDDDVDRGEVAREIGDVIDVDVPESILDGVTAGEWIEGTRRWIDAEIELPALESRAEEAEEALEANSGHPRADDLREALDDLREEIERRKPDE